MTTTVLSCESAKGLSVCPKCDAMVPDYCREAEMPPATRVGPVATTQPPAAESPVVVAPKRRKGTT